MRSMSLLVLCLQEKPLLCFAVSNLSPTKAGNSSDAPSFFFFFRLLSYFEGVVFVLVLFSFIINNRFVDGYRRF